MRRAAFSILLLAFFLDACRRETPVPPPAPVTKVETTTPKAGGRLERRLENDVKTLDYILQTEEEEKQVLAYLYDPLIALDRTLNPIPGIATRWDVSADGRTYTLHLDPRATFSDGTPVKASDVVFTLTRILDEPSPQFAGWFEGLDRKQTTAIDDRTVRVVFDDARVTRLLSFNISVIPEHAHGKKTIIGNGPYVLKTREPGRSILVERRADYWREKPLIESVLFRVIAEDHVAWNALTREEVDVARISNDIWWREKDKPATKQKMDFITAWLLSYNCIAWNVEDPLFDDARVRRALAMTFDRATVIEKLYHGQARPVTGPFTPDQWANNPEVLPIEFNPQAAAVLLGTVGWRDTNGDGVLDRDGRKFEFTLLIPVSVVAREQSQVLQDALKKIGVVANISTMDGAAFFDRVLNRKFQAAFFAWVVEPDPDRDAYALFHSSQKAPVGLNVGGYANPEADQLIEQGRVEFDRERRVEIYRQLHDLLARDQPYLWTVQVASKWAVNKRVQNVGVSNGYGLFHWHPGPFAWWLKP